MLCELMASCASPVGRWGGGHPTKTIVVTVTVEREGVVSRGVSGSSLPGRKDAGSLAMANMMSVGTTVG